jgi:hypothetical protein
MLKPGLAFSVPPGPFTNFVRALLRSELRFNPRRVIEFPKRTKEEGDGMPIKLDGMSEVTRNMEQLKRALDGAVARLSFDPSKPQDVERAIREIEMKVDLKMAPYISSPGVREIASNLKNECRKAILQKVDDARK